MQRRGSRSGEQVERRPDGEAEHAANLAAGREPVDARSGAPIDPEDRGLLERPDHGGDPGKDRRGLSDMADPEPDDNVS